ncbi:hypothetical protein ABL78_3414, partial [Leptomonas seymouri]
MRALWTALGLQSATVEALTAVCQRRQLDPHPARTSLDDVYEEEVVDLTSPDDRILHVEPLPRPPPPARPGATHYAVMELATLLTRVPATVTSAGGGAWSSAVPLHAGLCDLANEPLNDSVWVEAMGRSVLAVSADYRAAAAAAARGGPRGDRGGRGNRQLARHTHHAAELHAALPIASTYVICFPGGCVTWCPSSTLGLTSAERRERRHAAAQRRRRRRHRRHADDLDSSARAPDGPQDEDDDSSDSDTASDADDELVVQHVKSWEQLQASVFHRLRYMASRGEADASCGSGAACTGSAALSTSGFVSLLLSAVCYAYLPNTSAALDEVEAIDSKLSLIGSNVESHHSDALRRVLLLRRRLSMHRRLLFQKIRLLESLGRPVMHTVAGFVRAVELPRWTSHTAAAVSDAQVKAHVEDAAETAIEGSPRCGVAAEMTSRVGSANGNSGVNNTSDACFLPAGVSQSSRGKRNVDMGLSHAHLPELPSLNAIHKGISSVLSNLEVARTVLGNTTLIYTS